MMRSLFAFVTLVAVVPVSAQGNDPVGVPPAAPGNRGSFRRFVSSSGLPPGALGRCPIGRLPDRTAGPAVRTPLGTRRSSVGSLRHRRPKRPSPERSSRCSRRRALQLQARRHRHARTRHSRASGVRVISSSRPGPPRVGDQNPRQTLATVLVMYGAVRAGQVVLPLEPVANPGAVDPVAVTGPTAEIIVSREPRDVAQAGMVLFASMGRAAGVHIGDFVEIRRHPGPRLNAADTIDDLIAVAQVIHVNEKSCTIKLTRTWSIPISALAPRLSGSRHFRAEAGGRSPLSFCAVIL